MVLVGTITIVIYIILIAWTWQSLGSIENNKKLIYLVIGLFMIYGLTFLTFQISKSGITYENKEIESSIQTLLVIIFSGINGVILMPLMAKILDKMNENEIEKEQVKKRIIFWLMIGLVCLIFESSYMKDTQKGIMQVYHALR